MNTRREIYIGTVALDRNRWGSRAPSLLVSDWLGRFEVDGFDGVELWEFHYLSADEAEQARLETAAPFAIYNSYVGFADADANARERAADAVVRLKASAVKYNLGGDMAKVDEYRRNLLAWADLLPASCHLLCECHPGTVLEAIENAAAFFGELDPGRFGVIAHCSGAPAALEPWLDTFGARVQHLHLQFRESESDPAMAANRQRLDACFDLLKQHGFAGSAAIEFSRGIGREEDIETLYANACIDVAYVRERLAW